MPIKNNSDHPYFQVGEEVVIKISQERAIILSSKRIGKAWEHKVKFVDRSFTIGLDGEFVTIHGKDYPSSKRQIIRDFSERSLAKCFNTGTMHFSKLLDYCNGLSYG